MSTPGLQLRPVTDLDRDRLGELLALPPVYRFLNDGEPPPSEAVNGWIDEALASDRAFRGLWLLCDPRDAVVGCVRLSEPDDAVASAELTYVLHPDLWGRGLATRMAASIVRFAFDNGAEAIVAGADQPNEASIRVMDRLGMRFLRSVDYPAGPGVEYLLERAGALPGIEAVEGIPVVGS